MMRIKSFAFCMLLALFSFAFGRGFNQVSIDMSISAVDHLGETFAIPARSSTRAIYYTGEELRFGISLMNYAADEVLLSLPETNVTEHFAFRWLETPNKKVRPMLRFKPGPVYQGREFKRSAQIENATKLAPHGTISTEWNLLLANGSTLLPGHYEFEVTYVVPPELQQLLERSGRRVMVHGTSFKFEFRKPTTIEDELEIIYRAAARAYLSKDYDKAVTKLKELLAVYPKSSAAYSLLGRIHFDTGDYVQAIKYDQKAIDLLESGADVVRLKYWAMGQNKDHIIELIRGRIEVAKQRLQKR
ncbi:MAG: hypothetical protein NZ823_15320 [Blastocatellia bacterium]|nr:hypothetical protein [Blastocatellia bacterium]